MSTYDRFMVDDDSIKNMNRIKLFGLLQDDYGYTVMDATPYDIRMVSNESVYAPTTYVSILHSRYMFSELYHQRSEILLLCRDTYGITMHDGLIIGNDKVPNVVMSYRDPNLIDKMKLNFL